MRKRASLLLGAGAIGLMGLIGATITQAFTQPQHVSTTFEGCRLPAGTTLPSSLICEDAWYTSGNLGKSWNELDLVPFRLTTKLGTQGSATTTYNLYIAADHKDAPLGSPGNFGYDVITAPVVNAEKSHASCQVSAMSQSTINGVTGGTYETVYRQIQITQDKGTTCVIDWVQRLAVGAAQYSGSNLQAYIFTQSNFLGGKSTIPIPVKEILPQDIDKTMSATRDAATTWNITKNATPGSVDFGDVCKATTLEKPVAVTVTWTKVGVTPSGDVTALTNISVHNPAARSIKVSVTDKVYASADGTGSVIATDTHTATVAAGFNGLFKTFTYVIPAAVAGNIGDWLSDVVTASYTDEITNVPVPGTTTATAKTQIQLGTTVNETVNIGDLEEITGTGLSFKVANPGLGAFDGYTPPNLATSVKWGVTGLTDSGSVTFNKTVVLDEKRITTGQLDDVATLVSTDSQYTQQATLFPIGISSHARVELTVIKTIPLALEAGERVETLFTVEPSGGSAFPVTVTHTGPSAIGASAQTVVTNLDPNIYTVTEVESKYYASPAAVGAVLPFVAAPPQAVKDLSPKAGGIMDSTNCTGSLTFVNSVAGTDLPRAQVAKITLPAQSSGDAGYTWTFTLYGPEGAIETKTANAGGPAVLFDFLIGDEGTYWIEEVLKAKWDLYGIVQPDGSASSDTKCTFSVNFPADYSKTFACTFTNRMRGEGKVVKTVESAAPTGDHAFEFQLRQGASSIANGTTLETLVANAGNGGTIAFTTLLVPGATYQICEVVKPGWMTTLGTFVPEAFNPPDGKTPNPDVDNSILCGDFTVGPGDTKTFTVDNSPPPGGRALTIGFWKNHASCSSSSQKKFNATALDEALFGSNGILLGSKIASVANPGQFGIYGQNATSTADCQFAVSLLDKRNFNGRKQASDPLFNMAAQLVAAQLNLLSGAYTCPDVANAVLAANNLLDKYGFTGYGYTGNLTKADANLANSLATKLDDYNNNRPGVCP